MDVGLVMKEAMKSRGININISGCLAKALVQYAELLASQGYLTAAFTFLGETSDEVLYIENFAMHYWAY